MEHLFRHHVHLQDSYLIGLIFLAGIDELHLLSALDASVHNLEICNNASEGIEHRVKDEGLQRCILITTGWSNTVNNGIQYLLHTLPCSGTGTDDILMLATYEVHNFVLNLLRHGIGHIALVHNRDYLQVVINSHVKIGNGLCLYSLSSIHH